MGRGLELADSCRRRRPLSRTWRCCTRPYWEGIDHFRIRILANPPSQKRRTRALLQSPTEYRSTPTVTRSHPAHRQLNIPKFRPEALKPRPKRHRESRPWREGFSSFKLPYHHHPPAIHQNTQPREKKTKTKQSEQIEPASRHVRGLRARAPEQCAPGGAVGQGLVPARRDRGHLRQCAGA